MKILEVRRESQRIQCVSFLRRERALDLYLYEGVAAKGRGYRTYMFYSQNRIVGTTHTKSGAHFHLFLADRATERDVGEVSGFLHGEFQMLTSVFGDRGGVERIVDQPGWEVVKSRHFLSMELKKAGYTRKGDSGSAGGSVEGKLEMAELLLPLQMQYEVEELGMERSDLDWKRTLMSLRARLSRGEVTLLFEAGRLVACAGVNARFEGTCQIGSVYVAPSHRGKGFGTSVVEAHLARMFERFERVVLFVGRENRAACRIYEKLGFRTLGELAFAQLAPAR